MIELLIALAVLFAIAALAVRRWHRRLHERRLPGHSPHTAIPVEDYSDIDAALELETCTCGGRFTLRGEGPVRGPSSSLRMTRAECRRCARELVLYFDMKPTMQRRLRGLLLL